jgi:hypothetical protein
MPFLAAIPAALGLGGGLGGALTAGSLVGGSIASSALGRKSKTKRVLSPAQQRIEALFADRAGAILEDPKAGTEPLRVQQLDQVNRRFEGSGERLTEKLSQQGFGRSGKVGSGLKGLEIARQRGLSDVEASIAQLILGREMDVLGLANRFLLPSGSQTTGGGGIGAGIGAGVEGISSLLMFDKLLNARTPPFVPAG